MTTTPISKKASCRLPQPILDAISKTKATLSEGWSAPKSGPQLELFAQGFRDADAWETEVLTFANGIERYLSWDYDRICHEATLIPGRMAAFITTRSPGQALELIERMFSVEIPGRRSEQACRDYLLPQLWSGRSTRINSWFDIQPCLMRLFNVKFWRRLLWLRVLQAREELHLRLGLVGRNADKYVSEAGLAVRKAQRARHAKYMSTTTIEASINGETVSLPLEQVAATAEQRMSKIYAFVSAMDRMAIQNGLTVALITATLEGEWHPNPSHGRSDTKWNGKNPKEANAEMGRRWAAVRRDLDNLGVRMAGIWAGEPHADACPHRHFWSIYRPEHAHIIYEVFSRHFPGTPGTAAAVKVRHPALGDIVFDTPADAAALNLRFAEFDHRDPKGKKTELAQVEFSVIDRTPSKPGEPRKASGASYAFKYIEAAMLANEEEETDEKDEDGKKKKKQTEKGAAFARIDAHRSIWRLRAYQFFGIKDCLSLWDELRRLQEPPSELALHELWLAARGGPATGRVVTGTQRGDAWAFLQLQGGLATFDDVTATKAAKKAFKARVMAGEEIVRSAPSLARDTVLTGFQEEGKKIVGIQLVQECYQPSFKPDSDGVLDVYSRGRYKGRTKPAGWSWQPAASVVERTRTIVWRLRFSS